MKELQIGDLRVKLPIIQGGMGVGVSLSGLASAVAREGGIGVISASGIGMREPDYSKNFTGANIYALQKEIRRAKSLTLGVLGVNIMMVMTDYEAMIRVALEEKIDLIVLSAGLPMHIPAFLLRSGLDPGNTKFAVKVSSAKAARLIFQSWANKYNCLPDAVVVEGPRAGGHLGFKKEELTRELIPLETLIRETVAIIRPFEDQFSKEVPVIAAGGIYTGHDIYDIMQAGAKGVKMGTRFVTTHECDAAPAFKESFLNCEKEDLTIIESPVKLPGRVILNDFVREIKVGRKKPFKCAWHCLSACNFKEAPYCIAQVLFNAAQGNMDEGFAFSGTNGYRATQLEYTAEVMKELVMEYHERELVDMEMINCLSAHQKAIAPEYSDVCI